MALDELKQIIKDKYLHRGDYTLSSGRKSSLYFDIKGMMGDQDHALELASALIHETPLYKDYRNPMKIGSLGGLELGGVPLVAIMATMFDHEVGDFFYPELENICYIRKQQRIHGLKKMIEGAPKSPILLVDDVITTGETIQDGIYECVKAGYEIAGVLCVINRSEKYSRLMYIPETRAYNGNALSIPIYSLFRESDFV